ncbi:MAG TPA: phosphonate metabolism transcriptional regulator PhnF [Devosiaceae bacterium]|jgi:GntR family phosphonate transport system transcriptional regulator
MTERRTGTPLWQYIADTLTQEIRDRVFGPGEQLPTETDLAQRFGVNRHTVRRAVASLQDFGLIRIEQGRGTFVQEDIVDYPLSKRTRFSEIIRRQARTSSGILLRSATIPADPAIAEALEISPGAPVALIETVGSVDGQPISLAAHHFPLDRFPDLFDAYEAERKITPMLQRLGVGDYLRKTTRVLARMPDGHEMRHLHLARMTPILCLEAINVDGQNRPIEYGLTRFSSTRVQVVIDTLSENDRSSLA